MEIVLRKYLWALDCGVIVLVAFFSAQAASVGIDAALLRWMPSHHPARASVAPVDTTVERKDTARIITRNIFCSACPPPGGAPATQNDLQPLGPQKSMLPLKVMAIMFDPTPVGPRWSTAVIRDTTLSFAGPYGLGDRVKGATIVEIRQTRVYLDNAGHSEFLDLMDPSAIQSSPTAPANEISPPNPSATPPIAPRPVAATVMTSSLFSVRGDRSKKKP